MLAKDGSVPNAPTWTSHGFYSLNSRPGLTIHDSTSHAYPRLFPLPSPSFPVLEHLQRFRTVVDPDLRSLQNLPQHISSERHIPEPAHHFAIAPPHPPQPANPIRKRRNEASSFRHDFSRGQRQVENLHDRPSQRSALFNTNLRPSLHRKSWISSQTSVSPPIPFSTFDATFEHDSDPTKATSVLEEHVEEKSDANTWRRGSGPITHLRFGNDSVVVFPQSGYLNSLVACKIRTSDLCSYDASSIENFAEPEAIPDFMMHHNSLVRMINGASCSDHSPDCKLLVSASQSVTVVKIKSESEGPVLKWEDQIHVPNVFSCALNPHYAEEVSILSADGLYCGTTDRYTAAQRDPAMFQDSFHDIQTLSPQTRFRQVEYGVHPRSVLLASRSELARLDLRSHRLHSHRNTIIDMRQEPSRHARESEIGSFCPVLGEGEFFIVVATKASLSYFDLRRPDVPVLDWSLHLPVAPDTISVAAQKQERSRSDVLLLGSSQWNHAEVFHAIHTTAEEIIPQWNSSEGSSEFKLPRLPLLWSDVPRTLRTMHTIGDNVIGYAVALHENSRKASVIQWSLQTGLMFHNFDIGNQRARDEEPSFLSIRNGSVIQESSVNLRNTIMPLQRLLHHACCCARFPVSRSSPGSFLYSRTRKLRQDDARELRKRICTAHDDDVDKARVKRIPRPWMRDLDPSSSIEEEKSSYVTSSVVIETPRPDLELEALGENPSNDLILPEEPDMCDTPQSETFDLLDVIDGGCLFDELARSARSGVAHASLPLGVTGLEEAVIQSPFVKSYESVWHARCTEEHSNMSASVTTNNELPPWVWKTVYYTAAERKGESFRSSSIPESSPYYALLSRMQVTFFD